jgi:hypothetical protein
MRLNSPSSNEERLNQELDALFAAYRQACPDPEPSPDFMPRIWKQIEARRSVAYSFGRWTQAFITAAAAICLLFGLLNAYLPSQSDFYTQSYVEALAEESAADMGPTFEMVLTDTGGGAVQ